MEKILETTVGDTGFAWEFALKDSEGTARDLTGATGTFRAQIENGTAIAVQGAIELMVAASGTCKYTLQSGDFATPGRYYAEVEVLFPGGEITTYRDFIVKVYPQLPRSI